MELERQVPVHRPRDGGNGKAEKKIEDENPDSGRAGHLAVDDSLGRGPCGAYHV